MINAPPFTVAVTPPPAGGGGRFVFAIDAPLPHTKHESLTITFRGFVLRADRTLPIPTRLLFMADGRELWACDIDKPRPDVADAMANQPCFDPTNEKERLCGFDSVLPSFLSEHQNRVIDVYVDFCQDDPDAMTPSVLLCGLRFEGAGRFATSDGVGIAVINSIGRSGSSLLGRVLEHHPMMYVPTLEGQYGEVFILGFFARALASLSSEGSLSYVNNLIPEPDFIMTTSGYFGLDEQPDGLESDLRSRLERILFRHCCQMNHEAVEAVTRYVAQRKPTARYWLEKNWNNYSLNLLRAMNRNFREVILVRHPLDFWRSQELYHRKILSPVRERLEHVRATFDKYKHLANTAHDRRDLVCLIRYEDLTNQPEATLRQVCDYLTIDAHPEFLAQSSRIIRDGGEFQKRIQTNDTGGTCAEDFRRYLASLCSSDRSQLVAFCESVDYRLGE